MNVQIWGMVNLDPWFFIHRREFLENNKNYPTTNILCIYFVNKTCHTAQQTIKP